MYSKKKNIQSVFENGNIYIEMQKITIKKIGVFFVVQPKVNVRIPTQIVFEFVLINNNIIIYQYGSDLSSFDLFSSISMIIQGARWAYGAIRVALRFQQIL